MAALAHLIGSIPTKLGVIYTTKERQEENKLLFVTTELKIENGCLQQKNFHDPYEGKWCFSTGILAQIAGHKSQDLLSSVVLGICNKSCPRKD